MCDLTHHQPLGTEDYKGVLHHYEIVYRQKGATHVLNCSTTDSQYTLQLPLAVTELNVSAVTSAGSSPPALVRLTCLGEAFLYIFHSMADVAPHQSAA